jgi:hypothetical protein
MLSRRVEDGMVLVAQAFAVILCVVGGMQIARGLAEGVIDAGVGGLVLWGAPRLMEFLRGD